jgi:F-type H+-transporting ATPase subunit delta
MSEERVEAYAKAFLEVARAEHALGAVEDELFRFARAMEASDELRNALTDATLPAAERMAIVEELMGKHAHPVSAQLAAFMVGVGRGRDLPAVVDAVVRHAAAERLHEVAEVRSAIPLDADQQARLAQALSIATGKQVEVKVIVDPSVMGGLVAHIGDTVIDGTVRRRLEQLKERI